MDVIAFEDYYKKLNHSEQAMLYKALRNKSWSPSVVVLAGQSKEYFRQDTVIIENWIQNNCIGKYCFISHFNGVLLFQLKKDAMLFKMKYTV